MLRGLLYNTPVILGEGGNWEDDLPMQGEPLKQHWLKHPDTVFLAATRKAVQILNDVMVQELFANETPLGQVMTNSKENKKLVLFQGMSVMVTYNQDKTVGAVNGALGRVVALTRSQVTLHLQNGNVAAIHWQTWMKDDVHIAGFPLVAAYAVTIAKMLGRTLPSVTILPDIISYF